MFLRVEHIYGRIKMKKKLIKLYVFLVSVFGALMFIGWHAEVLGFNGEKLVYTLVIIGIPLYIIYRVIRRKRANKA